MLGVLEQCNNKEFELSSQYILKSIRRLVVITTEIAQRTETSGENFDKVLKKVGLVTDAIQNCIKNPDSPEFYLKMLCIDLLKELQGEYITSILLNFESMLKPDLCYDVEEFNKICFIFECLQSVSFNPSNLPHLLKLVKKLGGIISKIGVSNEAKTKADPIEMLVILINLAQNTIDNPVYVPEQLDDESKKQIYKFSTQLEDLFSSLLSDLTQVYENAAKITVTETNDPIQEFLAVDSLMTSAQKERQEKGIEGEEDDEEPKTQNDIILYQSLTNLLLLISGLQSKVDFCKKITVGKLFSQVSGSLSKISKLSNKEGYSVESTKSSLRQLLNLQSSLFTRIVIKSLDQIEKKMSSRHNTFINDSKKFISSTIVNILFRLRDLYQGYCDLFRILQGKDAFLDIYNEENPY